MDQIIKENYIIFDSKATTKDEALKELAKLGKKLGLIDSEKKLYEGYIKREEEFSTGLEDGFAIPHSRIPEVKEPGILFVRYENEIKDWITFDGSAIKNVISLIIPDNTEGSANHIALLSTVSQQLLDPAKRETLKNTQDKQEIIKTLLSSETQENKNVNVTNPNKYLVAITGCPAGVAHTYMAAKKIEDYAKSKGWEIKVEKQGANGIEDRITAEDVKNASALLIAADINPVELERFDSLPQVKVGVAEPMHNMDKVWNQVLTIDNGVVFKPNKTQVVLDKDGANQKFKTRFKYQALGLKNAILTGISFVVPVIVAGTVIVALITIITQIAGAEVIAQKAGWLNKISNVAGGALSILLAPILAAYISYAMSDKPGLFPGFLGGLACNAVTYSKNVDGVDTVIVAGLGFLGGLITGIICGYMMKGFKRWIRSKKFQGVFSWFVYPVLSSLIIICLILFVLGYPIALLTSAIFDGLTGLSKTKASVVVGMIIGALCVLDLGGPFNKVAWAFSFASFTGAFGANNELTKPELLSPYTAFWAAGIGTGWTATLVSCVFGRKFSTTEEKETGKISWIMSSLGITEGGIPFMLADPIRVIPGFVLGGATAGGISYALNLGSNIPGGGFITMAGVNSTTGEVNQGIAIVFFMLAALVGTAVSTGYILGMKYLAQNKHANLITRYYFLKIITFSFYKGTKPEKVDTIQTIGTSNKIIEETNKKTKRKKQKWGAIENNANR